VVVVDGEPGPERSSEQGDRQLASPVIVVGRVARWSGQHPTKADRRSGGVRRDTVLCDELS
jgi:hypothetical protein